MTTEHRDERLRKLFAVVIALNAEERAQFVEEHCAGDEWLRCELESLLRHHQSAEDLTGLPAFTVDKSTDHASLVGRTIGHYRVQSYLGSGGMSVVYRAEQEHPRRIVALKVIDQGIASSRTIRRFEVEAQILGQMHHPGIAQIFEAGTYDAGHGPQPFLAMELVVGLPLTEYAKAHDLDTRQRLQLMAHICHAVQHAHLKGVIHRDLKPGNILITDDGDPKVLDFGIARATESDLQITTLNTNIGQLIGTLAYMSPEQTSGDSENLDTRSDVYSLGVVCYELLAGRLPYILPDGLVPQALRIIHDEHPVCISSVDRTLRGDVEIIVGKALEKEPDRRYQSALDFAEDIERYLRNEPIVARPPSTGYIISRFAQRNKALVGGVAATVVALVAGLIFSLALLSEANRAWAAETQRSGELETLSQFQANQLSGINVQLMGTRLRSDLLERARAARVNTGADPLQVERDIDQLDRLIAGVNFTDVALTSLDNNILETSVGAIDAQFSSQPLLRARLLQTIATTARELGLFVRAANPQSEALAIRLHELGERDPRTLSSQSEMAQLEFAQGDFVGAEDRFRTVLSGARTTLGANASETITALGNLAEVLVATGRLSDARPLLFEHLQRARRAYGESDARSLIAMGAVGVLLQDEGRLSEAETYCRSAMEGFQSHYGADDPRTLTAMNNLELLLQRTKNYDEAESLARQVLESRRRVLGDQHPSTLTALNNLGLILQNRGHHGEALGIYRQCLQMEMRTLGKRDSSTLTTLHNVASALWKLGRLPEAENRFRDVLESETDVLGASHPDRLITVLNLATLLKQEGKFADAESLLLEAMTNSQTLPDTHDLRRDIPLNIVELYKTWDVAEPNKGYDIRAQDWRAKFSAANAEVTRAKRDRDRERESDFPNEGDGAKGPSEEPSGG